MKLVGKHGHSLLAIILDSSDGEGFFRGKMVVKGAFRNSRSVDQFVNSHVVETAVAFGSI